MVFVCFSVHIINNPEAKGSNVPAWPTFLARVMYLIFLTAWKEDHPSGLFINNISPSGLVGGGVFVDMPTEVFSFPEETSRSFGVSKA